MTKIDSSNEALSDSEPESQPSKKALDLKGHMWRLSRSGWHQVGLSILVGLAWTLFHIPHKGKALSLALGTFSAYFGFLVGVAAILILVSSMTVGLLVYFFQMHSSNTSNLAKKLSGYSRE